MLIDAAVDGQGVALARTTLAASDLISGRLVRPVDIALRLNNAYWIVCPKVSAAKPKIAAFRAWLLAEAAEDAKRLKEREDRFVKSRVRRTLTLVLRARSKLRPQAIGN